MTQVARNRTDCVDGFLKQTRYPILDRDRLYMRAFRTMLKDVGVKVVRLPARSPDLNSYAERWVRSERGECLSRIILLGELRLRRTLNDYRVHYLGERFHQGLGGTLIAPRSASENDNSASDAIRCRSRLGGLLNYYHRDVA